MLSDRDIDEYYSQEPKYGGCFSAAHLRKAKPNKFWILNLDDPNGGGTHWVLLSMLTPKKPFYFDSFGVPPDDGVLKAIRGNKSSPKILYNTVQLQGLENNDCGSYCIDVANHLLQGESPERVLDSFDLQNTTENARLVVEHAWPGKSKTSKAKGGKSTVGTGLPRMFFKKKE